MQTNEHILAELKDIAPALAKAGIVMPYVVPEGYFAAFPGSMSAEVANAAKLPLAIEQPFNVPSGYFDGLAASVLAKVTQQEENVYSELLEIAPLLHSIPRNNMYSVPDGYFETLKVAVPVTQPTRVVSLRRTRKRMQYAAAAVVAGVLVTSAFLFTGEPAYRKYSRMDVPVELQKVSEDDLAGYLYNPERITVTASQGSLATVHENINAMSDEELTNYLSDNRDAEMAVSVSN